MQNIKTGENSWDGRAEQMQNYEITRKGWGGSVWNAAVG